MSTSVVAAGGPVWVSHCFDKTHKTKSLFKHLQTFIMYFALLFLGKKHALKPVLVLIHSNVNVG